MKKNLSVVALNGPGLTVRGVNSPQNSKKVEGFDKTSTSQSFSTKIQKLKNKPKKESLEDAYVKGLQDEIHYLQMELKLLKEKQIAKHSQVDQLETFFGDGIPINENILALKNGFSNYKSQMDKKINSMEAEKKEREHIITSLSTKITEITKTIQQEQKKYKNQLTTKSNVTHQKIKKQALLKQQIQFEQQSFNTLKSQNTKLKQTLKDLDTAKQLLLISILRNDNNKYKKLTKLRETIVQQEKQFEILGKQYQELKKQDDQQTYVINIQQNNIKLKKKLISLERQFNALHVKSEEKKMELEAKLKERQKEINSRLDMQKRVDQIKDQIQTENNMSVGDLEKFSKEGEIKILESIIDKNKKLAKYVDYYGTLLSQVEESVYEKGEKKPTLKTELQEYQKMVKKLQEVLQGQKSKNCLLKSQLAELYSISCHTNQIVPPMIDDIKKESDKIKSCKIEREKLIQDIKVKEKQLQLMQILKSLNLQEVQISNSSNSSIQDRLIDFMRNWESLNRDT